MPNDKKPNATESSGPIHNPNHLLLVVGLIMFLLVGNTVVKHTKARQQTKIQSHQQAVQIQASSPTEPMVISLTADVWSEWVELKVIPGAQRNYLGPEKTKIEFSDGTTYELDDPSDWGIKYPKFRLLSPVAGVGKVITTLPS